MSFCIPLFRNHTIPFYSFCIILFDTIAIAIGITEIGLSFCISLFRCHTIPFYGFSIILFDAIAIVIGFTKI